MGRLSADVGRNGQFLFDLVFERRQSINDLMLDNPETSTELNTAHDKQKLEFAADSIRQFELLSTPEVYLDEKTNDGEPIWARYYENNNHYRCAYAHGPDCIGNFLPSLLAATLQIGDGNDGTQYTVNLRSAFFPLDITTVSMPMATMKRWTVLKICILSRSII